MNRNVLISQYILKQIAKGMGDKSNGSKKVTGHFDPIVFKMIVPY